MSLKCYFDGPRWQTYLWVPTVPSVSSVSQCYVFRKKKQQTVITKKGPRPFSRTSNQGNISDKTPNIWIINYSLNSNLWYNNIKMITARKFPEWKHLINHFFVTHVTIILIINKQRLSKLWRKNKKKQFNQWCTEIKRLINQSFITLEGISIIFFFFIIIHK